MKRIMILALGVTSAHLWSSHERVELSDTCFTGAFTAGYVFKYDDCIFKEVYGRGMINAITFDGCYNPWEHIGFGAKVSYWFAKGETTFHKLCTKLHEVPLTFYVRGMGNVACNLRLYASLGGGPLWIKEKSCLDCVRTVKGIAEAEVGVMYPIWSHVMITGAFRVLFPRQSLCDDGPKFTVGGCDLRAGIGFAF